MGENSIETEIALQKMAIVHLELDITAKHKQNRASIHELANGIQKCVDLITGIRIANARWNIAAGIITAAVIKGLELLTAHIK